MTSFVYGRTLAASLIAVGLAFATGPTASADTENASPGNPPAPAANFQEMDAAEPAGDGTNPAADACRQFSVALDYAASNYEDFAYASAGQGNIVDYADPTVRRSNIVGRTALRESAATAMDAAMTPGLPQEISSPMRAWSLHATKLLLLMGVHFGGDSLNNTASDLNADAHNVQLACAFAGTPV
jgi:hypothetical protein